MKLLILGGAGFIGINYLLSKLHTRQDVFCVDKLTYAANTHLLYHLMDKFRENFTFQEGDIADRVLMDKIFSLFRPDIVINFAAETHVDRSISEPDTFLSSNYLGVGVLLDLCRHYDIKRFHQVSTDEVYGDTPLHSEEKFSEECMLRPSNPYAAVKAAADLLVLSYFRTYRLPVTISRCVNNYGFYQHQEKLIPKLIECARRNEKLPLYGNGLNIREWIYVEDHCRAIDVILEKGCLGEVYNVGTDCFISNLEVAKTILNALSKPEDLITFVADRPGHDLRYALNYEKLQSLGWYPTYKKEAFIKKIKDLCHEKRGDLR